MTETRLISARCPNCGGAVKLPQDSRVGFCPYCNSDIVIEKESDRMMGGAVAGNVENLLMLADDFFRMGSYDEALDYYNKVLEIDVSQWRGWLERGRTLWWKSFSNDIYIDEMFDNFDKAEEYAPDNKKKEVEEKGYSYTLEIINYITSEGFLDGQPFYKFRENILFTLDTFKFIQWRYPNDVQILETIIDFCDNEIIEINSSYFEYAEKSALIKTIVDSRSYFFDKLLELDPSLELSNEISVKDSSSKKNNCLITCCISSMVLFIILFFLLIKGCLAL